MTTYSGRNSAVKLGTYTVVGQGNWNMEGVTIDQIDTSCFGTAWKSFEAGMSDGGQITFAGYYDMGDATGQTVLIAANQAGTHVTNLRFYVDNTSYYMADQTTVSSFILITNYSIKADKADIARVDFTAKVSGKMSLC
jgi:hypothetical protein